MQQKPITFSNSVNSTARLFFLGEVILRERKEQNITSPLFIITDKDEDISLMRKFANIILGQNIIIVETLGDYWKIDHTLPGIYCIPHTIIEIGGSIEYLQKQTLATIKRGTELSMDACIDTLLSYGYRHTDHRGELSTYKREGSIVSITTNTGALVQIEWFDTEIDSIIESSREGTRIFRENISIENLKPDTHKIERKIGVLNTELVNLLGMEAQIVLFGCDFLPYIELLRKYAYIHISDFHREDTTSLDISIPKIDHIDELIAYMGETGRPPTTIYTKYTKSVEDFLEFHKITEVNIVPIYKTGLESVVFASKELVSQSQIIISDDIIGRIFVKTRGRKSLAKNLDLLISLKPGDYVVHREHGIAKFDSVVKKTLGGGAQIGVQRTSFSEVSREYLELHYAEGDKLFVPLTEIYRVSKYLGELEPTLTKLSGKEWERTVEKADEEIEEIARDIIETSARRSIAKGRAFGVFRDEEEKFKKAFSYDYTLDQSQTIEEVFGDMESSEPMDRLLSGDVGFGKTEVAMNAIYKAVLSGTQVAVISPLLVLADEHYETFTDRLGPFGVKVGILTRMNSESEARQTLKKLSEGKLDVLVGTHRLLSEDIVWKKLGLLVIDEEHKFGVSHKEKIKKLRAGIDILALSATPIPRSLNLALSGLRKISLLTTPPKKKKPIRTIISKWHEPTIAHAINYELERGGQVIILHNRIRGMESIEKEMQGIMESTKIRNIGGKKPRIIITHGQMPGDQIEDRIHAFKKHEYDILLTTTIIENGVNFLSANTIIILDPEDFGLASLHQLRGRVGRKNEEGFCYLVYRKPELAKDEKERLITIANNSHLGAGFEIAMRDLEIRGAGDVLGVKQSGKSKDIGLTLYFRMLEEKIDVLKNEKKTRIPVKIELDLSYTIDDDLFLSEQDKLQFFRDIENIESLEELEDIEQEFLSPKGKGIEEIKNDNIGNLFTLLRARLILGEYGIKKLSKIGINFVFDFVDDIDPLRVKSFLERFDSKKSMVLLSLKKIRIDVSYWKSAQEFLEEITKR